MRHLPLVDQYKAFVDYLKNATAKRGKSTLLYQEEGPEIPAEDT